VPWVTACVGPVGSRRTAAPAVARRDRGAGRGADDRAFRAAEFGADVTVEHAAERRTEGGIERVRGGGVRGAERGRQHGGAKGGAWCRSVCLLDLESVEPARVTSRGRARALAVLECLTDKDWDTRSSDGFTTSHASVTGFSDPAGAPAHPRGRRALPVLRP